MSNVYLDTRLSAPPAGSYLEFINTIKLYERLCKYEGNPYSFLISHLYTRRWLPDHKFAWIRHTEKWDELVKAALGYNK